MDEPIPTLVRDPNKRCNAGRIGGYAQLVRIFNGQRRVFEIDE